MQNGIKTGLSRATAQGQAMLNLNDNTAAARLPDNLLDLLQHRAERLGERTAFTFLQDGEKESGSLSFSGLDLEARGLAAHLQSLGASNERVLLLLPAGLDYVSAFCACLYAGAVAVPLYPPRPNQNLQRLRSVIASAQAKYLLATSAVLARVQQEMQGDPLLCGLQLIDISTAGRMASAWKRPATPPDQLAFLQYTSGSTGSPKGVMLSHGNLMANSLAIAQAFAYQEGDATGVSWLPMYHDMGLIGGLLQPVLMGYRAVLMSPVDFLQHPFRWLKAISDYQAFLSAGPNFAYDFCARRVSKEQAQSLSLACWRIALSGAEPVRRETLVRFAQKFEPAGFQAKAFLPSYGLAEATLMVSGARVAPSYAAKKLDDEGLQNHQVRPATGDGGKWVVACGKPCAGSGSRVIIADPQAACLSPAGQVGEIWLNGPCVAQGYWNDADTTEAVFNARLQDTGEGPFLRTGDLGFIEDGELFITGRLKDLIVIRGANHYPQDIEATVLEEVQALRTGGCAAFSIDTGKAEALAVVLETSPRAVPSAEQVQDIRAAVRRVHELEIDFLVCVRLGQIPKTSSGKIRRSTCREAYLKGELAVLAEWRRDADEPESTAHSLAPAADAQPAVQADQQAVQGWFAQQLAQRLSVPAETISAHRPLSEYYLDSLAAVELSHALEKRFGLLFPLESMLSGLSIAELVRQAVPGPMALAARAQGPAQLSYGQQRLWFIWQLAPQSFTYNIFDAYRAHGDLKLELLQRCMDALVERHEILRTRFEDTAAGPVQIVMPAETLPIIWRDLSLPEAKGQAAEQELAQRLAQDTRQAFDLVSGPLLRLVVYRLAPGEHVLLMALHHIVADGWSAQILIRELGTLYAAFLAGRKPELPELPFQYADYAAWQSEWLNTRQAGQLAYWKKRLSGADLVLKLPLDKPRPAVQGVSGEQRSIQLDSALLGRLRQLSAAENATLFMTCLAAIQVLLHRYTGQACILVGAPISGRDRAGFEGVLGFFVNTLVMRADLTADMSFSGLLRQVRASVLEAYAHQDLPFHKVVDELDVPRDLSRSPVFQVSFTHHNLKSERLQLAGLELLPYRVDNNTTNFDIGISLVEQDGAAQCVMRYKTELFESASIERMLAHLKNLLSAAADDSSMPIGSLAMLSASDTQLLTHGWNSTRFDFGPCRYLHQMFEDRAASTPDAVALVFETQALTYAALNERTNCLAHHLAGMGIGPESRVGVAMERSLDMVVSLMAILKAGAAYVPLDPHYPAERLLYMLGDSGVEILLTEATLAASFAGQGRPGLRLVLIDQEWSQIARRPTANPEVPVHRQNLAYVIYTSGSTGRPKGAMNTHEAIANRIQWMQKQYALTADDRVLQKTPFSFDVSVWEFFWPLSVGARLVIARPRGHMDPEYLVKVCEQQAITTLHFVPSMLQLFLDSPDLHRCKALRRVICSGEALPAALSQRFFERCQAELHNLYGPTEAAVDVTAWACKPGSQPCIPIGRPIANLRMHVLGPDMQPVARGVTGELHIGGIGLARGYWLRPSLTAQRFVPDPFAAEPGQRLYKTGDLGRFLGNGDIEFLGRLDDQIKIRGFRIELGEIENVLLGHAAVRESTVLVKDQGTGKDRLVAALVPDWEQLRSEHALSEQLENIQVDQWQSLYEEQYGQAHSGEAQFNIVSWHSSYTGQAIDSGQMRQWVASTAERILDLPHGKVLEIGCGTGLMLFRVAPHCDEYWASDFSPKVISSLASSLGPELEPRTRLFTRNANDFQGLADAYFDSTVINSVIQYFPDTEYLTSVLRGAVRATRRGGKIFIGDVRNLRLLGMFHASVQLFQAADDMPLPQLRQRIARQVLQEKELLVDPGYFHALLVHLPRIGRVQILPKDGSYDNELSKYRYDVVLHLDTASPAASAGSPANWLDWQASGLDLARLAQVLDSPASGQAICLRNIPNARIQDDRIQWQLLEGADASIDVGSFKRQVLAHTRSFAQAGVEPSDLFVLAQRFGHSCELSWVDWVEDGSVGSLQACFWRGDATAMTGLDQLMQYAREVQDRPLASFTNCPVNLQLAQRLPAELGRYLASRLPEYMVPTAFHVLEAMPLNANGKVDRRALERLGIDMPANRPHAAPLNFVEESIALMWQELMGLERVSVEDNFFELGGHSLLLTQIASRIRTAFHTDIALMLLFDAPTVRAMAATVTSHLERQHAAELDSMIDELQSLSPEEIQRLLQEGELAE